MSASYLDVISIPSTTLAGPSVGVKVPVGTFTLDAGVTLTDNHVVVADGTITWDGADQADVGSGTALSNISVQIDEVPLTPSTSHTHVVYLVPESGFHSTYGDDVAMDIGISATDGVTEKLNLLTATSFTLGSDITMSAAYDHVGSTRGADVVNVTAVANRHFTLYPDLDVSESADGHSWYVVGAVHITGHAGNLTVYLEEPDGGMTNMLYPVVGTYSTPGDLSSFTPNATGDHVEIRAVKGSADAVNATLNADGSGDHGRARTATISINLVDAGSSTWSSGFEFTVAKAGALVYTPASADATSGGVNGYETSNDDAVVIGTAAVSASLTAVHLGPNHTSGVYQSADANFTVDPSTGVVQANDNLASSSETQRTLQAADIVYSENGRTVNIGSDYAFFKYRTLVVTAVNLIFANAYSYATFNDNVTGAASNDTIVATKVRTGRVFENDMQLRVTYQYGLGDGTVQITGASDVANANTSDDNSTSVLQTGASISIADAKTVAFGSDTSRTVTSASTVLLLDTSAFNPAAGTTEYYQVQLDASVANGGYSADTTADEIYRVYAELENGGYAASNTRMLYANANIGDGATILTAAQLVTGGIWRTLANGFEGVVDGNFDISNDAANIASVDAANTAVTVNIANITVTARQVFDVNITDLAGSGAVSNNCNKRVTVEWYTAPTATLSDSGGYDFSNGLLFVSGVSGTEDGGVLFDADQGVVSWSLGSEHNDLTISGGTALWTGNSGDGDVRAASNYIVAVYDEANENLADGVTATLQAITQDSVASDSTVTALVSSDSLSNANERFTLRVGYTAGPTPSAVNTFVATADGVVADGDGSTPLWAADYASYPMLLSTVALSLSSSSGAYDADWATAGPLINTAATGTAQALGDGDGITGAEDNETLLSNGGAAAVGVSGVTDDATYVLALLDRDANDSYSGTTGAPGTLAQYFSFVKADGTLLGRTLTVDTSDASPSFTSEWNSGSFSALSDVAGVVTVDDANANGAASSIQLVSTTHDAAMVLFTSNNATKPNLSGNVASAYVVPMVGVTAIILTSATLTPVSSSSSVGPDLVRFTVNLYQGSEVEVTDLAGAATYSHANNATDITVDNQLLWKLCVSGNTVPIHSDFDFSETETNLSRLQRHLIGASTYTDSDDNPANTNIDSEFLGGFPERTISSLATLANNGTFSGNLQSYDLLVQTSGGYDAGTENWVTATGVSSRNTTSAEHQFQDYAAQDGSGDVVGTVYRHGVADSGDTFYSEMASREVTLAVDGPSTVTRYSFAWSAP